MKESSISVYIVDDEISIVDSLVNDIEWILYDCRVVGYSTNATNAYEFIKDNPIDLLLTDIAMPGKSGLELIKSVKEKFPDIMVIVISAYDKFSYVKEAYSHGIINYCLKPIDKDEVYDCLKAAIRTKKERQKNYYSQDGRVFRNNIFVNLIYGKLNTNKLYERNEIAGIDYSVRPWQVALMDISSLEGTDAVALLKYYGERENRGYYSFLDGNMNMVFLLYGEAVSDEEWKIRKLLKAGNDNKENLFLSIGKPLESVHEVAASYKVCLDFMNAAFIFHRCTIQTEKYDYEKYVDITLKKEIQLLSKAVKFHNISEVIEGIRKNVQQCRTEEEKRKELTCISVYLINSTKSALGDNKISPIGFVDKQGTLENMLEWVENLGKKLIHSKEKNDSFMHPCVKYALREIDTRYADQTLSIYELAQSSNLTPAYLGKLFKEQTGESFSDYLLKSRMEKVQEMLSGSNLSVMDIAKATGFSSHNYLNRVFRKSFGMSPMEYKRRMNEKED